MFKLSNLLLLKVDCCVAIESSSFVQAVESVVVEAVDCCRLLCVIESSRFVEALVLLKLLNLLLLKLLIVVGYIMCFREL